MKKLKLQRETVRVLAHLDLGAVHGGAAVGGGTTTIIISPTRACPVLTNGCTGAGCVETITSGGTSVILPGGG